MSVFQSHRSGRRRFALVAYFLCALSIGFALPAAWNAATGSPSPSSTPDDPCSRPAPGSAVPEPEDLRSENGVLKLDLTIRNHQEPDGSSRYCYLLPDGSQSPTLRVHPGDLLVLHLKNELTELEPALTDAAQRDGGPMCTTKPKSSDPCSSGAMTAISTNLHFHGLTLPPVCHQDDVLKTSIQPTNGAFEYRFQIPPDEAPGLYWYHPHIHGFSAKQVSGGASGALIVEGLERANPVVAGLPERVLIIRDQTLLNPDAPPSTSGPAVPTIAVDRDGDTANTGTGTGRPARDLSVNFVAVPYPDYPPASIAMKPGERQLWRVLNASAITYVDLALMYQRAPQQLGIVAIDGVPINAASSGTPRISGFNHISVPPGARVEFIVTAPPSGGTAQLVSLAVDTGQGGENDPGRVLAAISTSPDAAEPRSILPAEHEPLPAPTLAWLGSVEPVRERKLYFSEELDDPNDPNSPTRFFITLDGQDPKSFDPNSDVPDIVVRQGDVEDWIIENRTNELHAFHIHQIHFQLMDWLGAPVNEAFLRDTINVPYYNGRSEKFPSVRLRMDFRDPNSVGTFLYHCHLLEHEDGGMMGTVRVEPPTKENSVSTLRLGRDR